jgi:hypothetical protein
MSVAASAGYPQYADSTINYIPQLFAPATLVKYYAKSCVAAVANTKYEGIIKNQGDKVTIRTRPNITVRAYTKGQKLTRETPSSAPVVLNIDQAQYYDFVIDDVDDAQADIVLSSEFTDEAAEQMRIKVDTDVLGKIYADADSANTGSTAGKISGNLNLGVSGTPLAVTKNNVVEVITLIGLVEDEQNVPDNDRWGIIPSWFRYLIMNSDLKNASIMGDGPSRLLNGRIGEVDGQTLYKSNLLSVVTDGTTKVTHSIWGQKDALTFAAQLTKNENLRCSDTFGWEYRGLYVYGRKVVKPEGLVHLYCYKG